jgi:signal transduction histidine kinase
MDSSDRQSGKDGFSLKAKIALQIRSLCSGFWGRFVDQIKNGMGTARLKYSLGTRLFLLLLLLEGMVFFLMTALIIRANREHQLEQKITNTKQAQQLLIGSFNYMFQNQKQGVDQTLQILGQQPGVESFRIYNKKGIVAFSSQRKEIGQAVDPQAERCTVCHRGERPLEFAPHPIRPLIFQSPRGYQVLALVYPIPNEPACGKPSCHPPLSTQKTLGMLYTKLSLAEVDQNIAESRNRLIFFALAAIVLIEFFSWLFISRMVSARVQQLADGTRQVMEGNLDFRLKEWGQDEISRLARSFNRMIAALQQAQTENRERTRELMAAQGRLAESARLAGKAEMAAGVLHNLGNAFNSINVRLAMIRDQRNLAAIESLERALELLDQNRPRWGPFLSEHPQGKQFLPFLRQWTEASRRDRQHLEETLEFVARRMEHIAEILRSQQGYYRSSLRAEPTDLNQTIREALSVMEDSLQKWGVEIEQELGDLPLIELDRSQVIQMIHNLVKNAMEAVEQNPEGDRRICLRSRVNPEAGQRLEIAVEDNGAGIRPEDLPRMFEFGFTTKADSGGHGFGLHASANYIQSVGGRIKAENRGTGRGAVFRVFFPLTEEKDETREKREKMEAKYEPAHLSY